MSVTKYNSFVSVKQGIKLSDYDENEKPWDRHRSETQKMEKILLPYEDEKIKHIRDRILQCSHWLIFAHTTPDERNRTFKLHETTFCRVRTCPVCQWRRSMRHVARFLEALPKITSEYPNHRWLHLTLTQKNCDISELRETIREMNSAWKRFMNLKAFKTAVLGYVRNIEVTRSPDGSAHPHMHILLMVPSAYFHKKKLYVKHDVWRDMWRDSARLDYDPQVCVKAIKQTDTENEVREVMKYATKPETLLEDAEWLVQYIYQVHNLRFLSAGGLVKKHLSTEEPNEDEMIVPGQDDEVDDSDVIAVTRFDWNRKKAGYYSAGTKIRTESDPQPTLEPWETWTDGLVEPIRRGDWEEQKKAEADTRMREILAEMKAEKGPSLETTLNATGNSWARKQAQDRKDILYQIRRERMRRKF